MSTDVAGPGGAVESKGLKAGALGLASTVVIGGPPRGALLGSVTYQVVHRATEPAVVVPSP